MQQKVLVFGGLGNIKSSVIRLYIPLLEQLSSRYTLFAIDPRAGHHTAQPAQNNISYNACYPDLNSYLEKQGVDNIISVLVLTPVGSHLSIVSALNSNITVENVLFVIEKPSFGLDEIQKGFGELIPNMKQQGALFYFIETALVTPSLEHFFSHSSYRHQLPIKVVAVAIDNPTHSIESLAEYQFLNRLPLLNERKLLDLDVSGGGGYGFDMGIHAISGLVRWIEMSKFSLKKLTFERVKLEVIDHYKLERTAGAETHLYAWGQLSTNYGSCPVFIEAGKAGDTWDRRLEIYYSDCVVVIGFGTLKHPPYLCEITEQETKQITFNVAETGYDIHANDILNLLKFDAPTTLNAQESEHLMSLSMSVLQQIFYVNGKTRKIRETNIEFCSQHNAYELSTRELEIRQELQAILNTYV